MHRKKEVHGLLCKRPGESGFSNIRIQGRVTNHVMRIQLTAGTAPRIQTPAPPLACGNRLGRRCRPVRISVAWRTAPVCPARRTGPVGMPLEGGHPVSAGQRRFGASENG
jgi:hypothetical protein